MHGAWVRIKAWAIIWPKPVFLLAVGALTGVAYVSRYTDSTLSRLCALFVGAGSVGLVCYVRWAVNMLAQRDGLEYSNEDER